MRSPSSSSAGPLAGGDRRAPYRPPAVRIPLHNGRFTSGQAVYQTSWHARRSLVGDSAMQGHLITEFAEWQFTKLRRVFFYNRHYACLTIHRTCAPVTCSSISGYRVIIWVFFRQRGKVSDRHILQNRIHQQSYRVRTSNTRKACMQLTTRKVPNTCIHSLHAYIYLYHAHKTQKNKQKT